MLVLLIIDNADAPTEYRFEGAIPEGHSATVTENGSVQFFDADGIEAGGVMAPWAVDADGKNIPTSHTIDGTTIVQTVEHHGAVYPVVADPLWIPVGVVIVRCAVSVFCRTTTIQAFRLAPAVAVSAWNARQAFAPSGDPNDPGRRPTNTCNMRNHAGC